MRGRRAGGRDRVATSLRGSRAVGFDTKRLDEEKKQRAPVGLADEHEIGAV